MLLLQNGVVSGAKCDFQVEAYQIRMFYEVEVFGSLLSNFAKERLWAGRIGYRGWLVRRTVGETWNDSGRNGRNIAMMKEQSQSDNAYEQLSILT